MKANLLPTKDYTYLIGKQVNDLTILGLPFYIRENNFKKYRHVVLSCKCGVIFTRRLDHLLKPRCKNIFCPKCTISKSITHNQTHTRLYKIWANMLWRCKTENPRFISTYGHVTVYDEWKKFEPFYKWSMCNGYTDTLTIDRKDSDLGYCPDNCRWVTIEENGLNVTLERDLKILKLEAKIEEYEKILKQHGLI